MMIAPATTLTALSALLLLQPASAEKKQIYLAGTFPIGGSEGWQGGQVSCPSLSLCLSLRYQMLPQACLPAALLALEDVNSNQDILTNYHINLAAKDDEVIVFY